ncbi:UDP-N-acetylmuramoylalanyl-D-glutamyl-2,6-diaminopimelate--D-alanyl-D-alanine ligase [Pseudohoeflea coraliihabitans]|uniref:UDP-N-acetylmuramoyl-tripeptide--D-alanyl-D-alanine ligase n=1 Tax=Pseudohoeflea coraliihabitans TaxID=2860393 RepID=A0ABS6WLC7_9HYPH|nr:UDP-N-acetylmuramoylalanyl-D-glutamyl-2,6-diaminopimelate--D-alanyl-D-alanine ligase [Pseudohoeflea sp. DP4N28-3]MBW3095925.1 UDP-N-acetylmuramoylalanyl-D-glutamyl-2,6-diaminopimelate--D-alanyl-D-alanine ligase [Pseudohoeflea sp. DP4N28-3]
MSRLWTAEAMVAAMNGRPVGNLPDGVDGISIDTRTLQKGDAFFAIKGDRFDGHDFASAAMAAGVGLMVVSEARLPALGRLNVPMIVVDDVLAALGALGAAARARSSAQVIAVTGSVGKTTSKEMLRHVLTPCGKVHAARASFNNHWGVPLTLARMPEDADFGVFEIGMNHPGEIRPLVKLVRPHIAIITTVAGAHLGNFKGLSEIAAAKAEIMEGLADGGTVLLNRDNEKFSQLRKRASELGVPQVRSFGAHKQASIRLMACEIGPEHSDTTVRLNARDLTLRVGAPGRHVVDNALAVLGAAAFAGADVDTVAAAFADFAPDKGRGARHHLAIGEGSVTLIDESYNANPASMRAALALLADAPVEAGGRRIAVLGDMLEMGRYAEKVHADLADAVIEAKADLVGLAGPEMKHLEAALGERVPVVWRETADELAAWLQETLEAGDVVVVKSSLGLGFGRIVAALCGAYPVLKPECSG